MTPGKYTLFPLLQNHPYPSWSPHTFLFNGYRCSLPRTKRPGHETDYSSPSGSDVINEWCYTPTSLICLYDVDWNYLSTFVTDQPRVVRTSVSVNTYLLRFSTQEHTEVFLEHDLTSGVKQLTPLPYYYNAWFLFPKAGITKTAETFNQMAHLVIQ